MKAADKIIGSFPNLEKTRPEFVASFIEALLYYPIWVIEVLAHPAHGLASKCEFLSIAGTVEMANQLIEREAELSAQRQKHEARSEKIAVPLGAYRDMEKSLTEDELDRRKAFVARELGYDPGKSRPARACFVPPMPSVDVSDFPPSAAIFNASPEAKPSSDQPWWRDKDELADSCARITSAYAVAQLESLQAAVEAKREEGEWF